MRHASLPISVIVGGISTLMSAQAAAAIALNQLSACDMLVEFRRAMDVSTPCRTPSTGPVRALVDRSRGLRGLAICVRPDPPTASQQGFECASIKIEGVRASVHLLCIRSIGQGDVQDYKSNYRSLYSAPVKRYLDAASACAVGNGDATVAVETLHPMLMLQISEFEFGFVLPVGNRLVGSSAFIHGIGKLDPSIDGSESSYAEYIYSWKELP